MKIFRARDSGYQRGSVELPARIGPLFRPLRLPTSAARWSMRNHPVFCGEAPVEHTNNSKYRCQRVKNLGGSTLRTFRMQELEVCEPVNAGTASA